MSASVNPSAPESPVQSAPPRPVVPNLSDPPSRRKWWAIGGCAVVLAGAWAFWPKPEAKQQAAVVIRTVTVAPGVVRNLLRVTGSTSARSFANITAPMMRGPDAGRALVLMSIGKSGSLVKKGDVIAQIDAQSIKDHLEDVDAMVVSAEADIRKRKAELEIEMEQERQALRSTKAQADKARLDQKASEIRTAIDQELLKLSVDEADAGYRQIQADMKVLAERQRSDLRLLELARDQQLRHRERHRVDLMRFTIKAPMSGLLVMQTVIRGGDMGQIQQGDQVSPGQPFAKVVDPASMQMDASINQAESEFVRLGQPAKVAFDAFPGLTLTGKVVAVGAMAVGGWRQNYYIRNIPIRIALEGFDPRVIPDLSASGDVTLSNTDSPVVVPREAVRTADGSKAVVYVKQAGAFAPREVETGATSNTQIAVVSGLRPGEVIAAQASAVLNR